jgi:hypothetical protein
VGAATAAAFGLALQAVEALLSVAAGAVFLAVEGVSLADLRREVRPARPQPAVPAIAPVRSEQRRPAAVAA